VVTDRPGVRLEASHIDCTPEPQPLKTDGSFAREGETFGSADPPLVSGESDWAASEVELDKLSKRLDKKLNMLAPHGVFGRKWPSANNLEPVRLLYRRLAIHAKQNCGSSARCLQINTGGRINYSIEMPCRRVLGVHSLRTV
jgi:hypothetical protein